MTDEKQRTKQQNRALHKFFTLLAEEFNQRGYDMRKVLSQNIDIPATPTLIKTCVWKPVQDSMYDKDSTTQLTTAEISKVYEVLNRHLGEQFQIHIPWPSTDELMLQDLTNN